MGKATTGKTKRKAASTTTAAITGTSAAAATGGEEVTMAKRAGDWTRSTMKLSKLEGYRRDGWLPSTEQLPTRLPGDEVCPQPKEGERVCFHDFVNRGFSFPIHDFVRGLMYAYKVQLHDFTPNSIMHIAVFVVLCECFLGIHPHWGLWKKIFTVRENAGKTGVYAIGGLNIQSRKEIAYFDIKQVDSAQNWRQKWFYVTTTQDGLPPFDPHATLQKTRAWLHQTTAEEEAEVKPLMGSIAKLMKTAGREVSGLHLISTFIKRGVQPLRARAHPLWEFQGLQDPTRLRAGQPLLPLDAVEKRVRSITKLTANDACPLDCPVDAFDTEHPVPEVNLCFFVTFTVAVCIE